MSSNAKDIGIGVVMLAIAGVYWFLADQLPTSPLDDPSVGAAGLPKSLSYTLAGLAAVLIGRAAFFPAPAKSGGEAATEEERAAAYAQTLKRHGRALGMLAIGVGYLLIVPYLGYTVSIALLMTAAAVYSGGELGAKIAAFAVVGAVAFYCLFVLFLGIPLPAGVWPSLFS